MRLFILVAVVLIVSSAGCTTIQSEAGPSETTKDTTTTQETTKDSTATTPMPTTSPGSDAGGKLFAYRVEQPPKNATIINSTDAQIRGLSLVQEVLRKAVEDGDAVRNINGTQLERLERELKEVPYTSGGKSGYYIRYEGTVVRVFIARYQ